jgi:hypothetical protein
MIDKDGIALCKDAAKGAIANLFASEGINSFTLFETAGYWEGVAEPSLVIEVFSEPERMRFDRALALSKNLAERLNQTAVLVTSETVLAKLVYS